MNEEGLRSIQRMVVNNGLVIKDIGVFSNAISNQNFNEVIERLNGLEEKINAKVDIDSFVRDLLRNVGELESVVDESIGSNIDLSFDNLLTTELTAFNNNLAFVHEKIGFVDNYLKSHRAFVDAEASYDNVLNEINELSNEADDTIRTSKFFELQIAKINAEKEKESAARRYEQNKNIYEETLKTLNFIDFRKELLDAFNALEDSFKQIARNLDPSIAKKIEDMIDNIHDSIIILGSEVIRAREEYNRICKSCGIEKNSKNISIDVVKEEPVLEETETPVIEESKPLIDEETPSLDIDNKVTLEEKPKELEHFSDSELFTELKQQIIDLNPSVNIDTALIDEKELLGVNSYYILTADTDLKDLKLPEGFTYTDDEKITNGKISVRFSKTLKKEDAIDNSLENPFKEMEVDIIELPPHEEELIIDTPEKLIEELKKVNPPIIEFAIKDFFGRKAIACSVAGDLLKMPEGFKYSQTKGIANDKTGIMIPVVTLTKEKKITNQDELIDDIVKGNAAKGINLAVETKIMNDVEVKYLVFDEKDKDKSFYAPEGFSFSLEDGFSNKSQNKDNYLAVDVVSSKTLNNTADNDLSDAPRIGDAFINRLKNNRVPSGKQEVTKERKAVLDAYAHSVLLAAAIPAVPAAIFGIGLSPVVIALLAGAGFGVAVQALYHKLVKGTTLSLKAYEEAKEYNDDPTKASVFMTLLAGGAPQLMDIYKAKRRLKKMQQLNNEQTTLDDTPNEELGGR